MLKEQFLGIDENNNKVDINQITQGSQRKVWWHHFTADGDEHRWIASVHNRVYRRSLCPQCNNYGTSLPEQIIYRSFKNIGLDVYNRYKYKGYEFDIIIRNPLIFIEYNGDYYHIGKEIHDEEKVELCSNDGIPFIRIIDDKSIRIDAETWNEHTIVANFSTGVNKIKKVIEHIASIYNIDMHNLNFNSVVNESMNFMLKDKR